MKKINEKWEYGIDTLIEKLAKPTFVLRMARPLEHENSSRGRAARKRARNARAQIQDILIEECWTKGNR